MDVLGVEDDIVDIPSASTSATTLVTPRTECLGAGGYLVSADDRRWCVKHYLCLNFSPLLAQFPDASDGVDSAESHGNL